MSDREWMYTGRPTERLMTEEWMTKMCEFLDHAFARGVRRTWCPCSVCRNQKERRQEEMGKHLVRNGFVAGYYVWTFHGESARARAEVVREDADDYDTGVVDMIDDFHDAQVPPFAEQPEPTAKTFYDMLEAARQPLHEHTKVCKLDAIGQMMALKTQFSWSRDCFDAVMGVVAGWLPEGHVLPKTLYESKKILRALNMPYEQIHACPKGCILFRKEHEHDKYCPQCKSSRYVEIDSGDGQLKQLKVPVNVLRYLPVIPRIQRLYMTEETAKQMTWHKVGKRYRKDANDREMMIHPSDGEAWKSFDGKHHVKAAEARNVRIAMSTDGFNPFGMTSASYSCWPMFVMPLNLPPPRRPYATKAHVPVADNSRARVPGKKHECVHAAVD